MYTLRYEQLALTMTRTF